MSEIKPFNLEVNGENYELTRENCAVALFRTKQEMDYLVVKGDNDAEVTRIFNYVNLCRWMGGLAMNLGEDGEMNVFSTYWENGDGDTGNTFRKQFGWNPSMTIMDSPPEWIEDRWVAVNTRAIDEEWQSGL